MQSKQQSSQYKNPMQEDSLTSMLNFISTNVLSRFIKQFNTVNARLEDEFLLTVSEQQINEALAKFVTRNVKAILEMTIELHDSWFRLSCIVNIQGIYTKVASNFDVVHIQLDRQRQRLVFAQKSETEILELHAKSYWKKHAIKKGVPLYRKIMKQDPLGVILKKIKLARVKENIFYIDIGRWLHKNDSIMTTLYKAQVNYATVKPEQLILQAKINPRDLLATNASGDIISEADKPKD